jgi:hypothetical protein
MKKILFLTLSTLFTTANFALAAGYKVTQTLPGSKEIVAGEEVAGGFVGYAASLWIFGISIGGVLALGSIVYAAIEWTVSAGNSSRIADAKDRITQAIIGLVLLFGAYTVLNFINPDLTQLGKINSVLSQIDNVPAPEGSETDGACPIPSLTPLTSEEALAMENGQKVTFESENGDIQENLVKLEKEYLELKQLVEADGGTITVNSAYRPLEYQRHFFEIADRLDKLEDFGVECQILRNKVEAEKAKHGLQGLVNPPNTCAPHVRGVGIDISINGSLFANNFEISGPNDPKVTAVNNLLAEHDIDLKWQGIADDEVHFNLKNPPFAGCAEE